MEALAEPWMGVAQLQRYGRLPLTKERQSHYSFRFFGCFAHPRGRSAR